MKSRIRSLVTLAAVIGMIAMCTPPAHAAVKGVKVGYLTCHVSSGWGLVFGSSREIRCTFSHGKESAYYSGSIAKFGADIGYLSSAVMLWTVVAPTTSLEPGALAGHYAGATAGVALGIGAGANVLVGGFKKSIALQPISIEGQQGLNVAAGIASLNLKFDKAETERMEKMEKK